MAGFKPVSTIGGGQLPSGALQTFSVNASHSTILAPGDLIRRTGGYDGANNRPEVDAAAAGNDLLGAIVSVGFQIAAPENTHLPASTAGTVTCYVGRDILYEAEVDAAMTVADFGQNMDINATAATATGNLVDSNMNLDVATVSTTTQQMRVVQAAYGVDTSGATIPAATKVLCHINESQHDATTGV
jgi:hypothetical protein